MKDKLIPWRSRSPQHEDDWTGHPFEMLHRELNNLFDTYYRGAGRPGRRTVLSAGFELSEADDEVQVKVELPGMDEKDIQVTIDENLLTIRGERKEQKETKKRNYHVSEMSYGGYSRTIPLPAEVDAGKAQARFKRGVLTLNLPKTEQAKAKRRQIPVSVD
jgi:HSP20 family protein